ncbi:MAG TPA: glycosyltransferase [Thermoleophilaceae bacterium]
MRVGVYSDMVFRRDGERVSTDKAFIRLVTALAGQAGEVVVFGRLDPTPGRAPYRVTGGNVRFVALPHYPRVTHVHAVAASLPRAAKTFGDELAGLDAAVVFGPHPVALAFALMTKRARVPLVLGVRHDYPEYLRHRLPGWRPAVQVARALDWAFLRLARTTPAVVVGPELARRYTAGGGELLELAVSLVPAREVVTPDRALARDWGRELRCLSVGRLAPEKNPLLLLDVVEELRRRNPRWRLVVAGDGPLRAVLERAVAARGLEPAVELLGEVSNGPRLWELYRTSHAFLHVSLTEGLPQVLVEAHAAGTPVVATEVGSVRAALADGERGLLVPPRDAAAAAAALERLVREADLRRRLVFAGIEHARSETLERQVARLWEFIARAADPHAPQPPRSHRPARRAATGNARTRATGTTPLRRTPAVPGTATQRDSRGRDAGSRNVA